jgi:phosphoribosylformimino-5-aminoimidazole carboxamide ribotide isomerase
MRIIPAIDIIEGRCVRLTEGDFDSVKVYDYSPLEAAKRFEHSGFEFLHLVDLDGAKTGTLSNLPVLEMICSATSLKVDFSGGIKTASDLKSVFDAGAAQASIGSIALEQSELFLDWLSRYGAEKIVLSADSKNRKVMSKGWTEGSERDILDYIDYYRRKGVIYVVCTDISRDGTLSGPALELYREILRIPAVKLIASGGISTIKDLDLLRQEGCYGVIVGKAIYEDRIKLSELARLC